MQLKTNLISCHISLSMWSFSLFALIQAFALNRKNFPDVIQSASFDGGTNCTESHLVQNCSPGGKVATLACVCLRVWGYFSTKSVCQQENSIDQRNIGSIVQKFFGTKFPKFACRELLLVLEPWRDERAREAGDSSNTSEKVSTNGGGCSRATINLAISAQRMKFLLKNFSTGDKVLALLLPDSNQSRPRQSASRRERHTMRIVGCRWRAEKEREVTWSDFLQRLDADLNCDLWAARAGISCFCMSSLVYPSSWCCLRRGDRNLFMLSSIISPQAT